MGRNTTNSRRTCQYDYGTVYGTGDVSKCFDPKIGIFPYPKYLEGLLKDNDGDRLNNLIYQENCVQSLSSLMSTGTQSRYWAFLEIQGGVSCYTDKKEALCYSETAGDP